MPQPSVHAAANEIWGDGWDAIRASWPLDPSRIHLNHGSYGAAPSVVLEAQQAWRERMETNPVRFFRYELEAAVDDARAQVAAFLNADVDGFAFVTNASTGATAVIESVELAAGDEVLMTNHAYGAVRLAVERACRRSGATLVVATVPFELGPSDEVVATVLGHVTERTRLAVVDHISSPTAALFPIAPLVSALQTAGVPVLVDAAHAPGMQPVDLAALAPDFWTGNFHKWACSPKGAAGLWVAPKWRDAIKALVVSWNDLDGYPQSFRFSGSADYTAWLATPAVVRWFGEIGWDRVRAHNYALAQYGQEVVAAALGAPLVQRPGDDHLSMRLVPLPEGLLNDELQARALQRRVSDELGIEVLMTAWHGRSLLRLSAQAYNCPADYEALAAGLPTVVAKASAA